MSNAELQKSITQTGVKLSEASFDELLSCTADLKNLFYIMMGAGAPIIERAHNSGSEKARSIKGKLPRSPLASANEPDAAFKSWCDLGSLYCAVHGDHDYFKTARREIMGDPYRFGQSILEVVKHARKHPHMYVNQKERHRRNAYSSVIMSG